MLLLGEMSNIRGDKVEINSNNIHIVQLINIVFFETKYYNTYIAKEFMQFLQSNYFIDEDNKHYVTLLTTIREFKSIAPD